MDCDACGRYRPSSEIIALRSPAGRFVMVCARCRRLAAGRRGPTQAGPMADLLAGPMAAPEPPAVVTVP